MITRKCAYCGEERLMDNNLKDYIYKKRDKLNQTIRYFCSYDCMRKAEKENPGKYGERKL